MQVGNRIYYNASTGNILFTAGEINNAEAPRDVDEIVEFIDVDYGSIDYSKNMIIGIDMENRVPILQPIENEEQRRIRELEDALLLAADAENGGIL
ncbi:hypothetical protein [Lysinibacillus piscis]|uniref:Uncharacterized protein n=1 Tax=Lysinibacillus piscis TaxID=2518931 RepID=A0ABQ5NK16_9BACI|nr:hypothetical protein [Lysinibacillus sp. KH24]GLC88710.1 hypothetical protein LYSBPC_18370 [Lysinibacillus sp. KH24]